MKIFLLILCFILIGKLSMGQFGTIKGHLYDKKKMENVQYANVVLLGSEIRTHSDSNGVFIIDSITPGYYDIKISMLVELDTILHSIQVFNDSTLFLNIDYPPICKYDRVGKQCPMCKRSNKVIPIIHGYPSSGLLRKEKLGEVYFAGA